jgi:hypothetical protein
MQALWPLFGITDSIAAVAKTTARSARGRTDEAAVEDTFYSSHSSRGFRAQLSVFLADLDPTGRMAKENFYPQKDHQLHKIEDKLHWSYIEVSPQ